MIHRLAGGFLGGSQVVRLLPDVCACLDSHVQSHVDIRAPALLKVLELCISVGLGNLG